MLFNFQPVFVLQPITIYVVLHPLHESTQSWPLLVMRLRAGHLPRYSFQVLKMLVGFQGQGEQGLIKASFQSFGG